MTDEGGSTPRQIKIGLVIDLRAALGEHSPPLDDEHSIDDDWNAALARVRWLKEAHRWACPELTYPDSPGPELPPELPRVLRALVHPEGAATIRLDLGPTSFSRSEDEVNAYQEEL